MAVNRALLRSQQISLRRQHVTERLRRGANAALAFAALLIGIAVVGWLFNIAELRSIIPGWPPMHPLMAVFGIGGVATLQLLGRDTPQARRAAIAVCGAVLIAAIAAAMVGLLILGPPLWGRIAG